MGKTAAITLASLIAITGGCGERVQRVHGAVTRPRGDGEAFGQVVAMPSSITLRSLRGAHGEAHIINPFDTELGVVGIDSRCSCGLHAEVEGRVPPFGDRKLTVVISNPRAVGEKEEVRLRWVSGERAGTLTVPIHRRD